MNSTNADISCPFDTNGDGDCGRRWCPYCGELKVELDINKRWEEGIPHHPKSIELFQALEKINFKYGGDSLSWDSGGDGDNGEFLMYDLDIYFELKDRGLTVDDI